MNFCLSDALAQTAAHRPDWGFVATAAGLVFAAIQAHRYWRATIRLEDEFAAYRKDTRFTLDRYDQAFRALGQPAAFVDRNSGRVIQVTPGWASAGLPGAGQVLWGGDSALEAAWAAIPAPSAEGAAAAEFVLHLAGRPCRALPLQGDSLGLVLVEPA